MKDTLRRLYVLLRSLKDDERGQDLIEYGLLAALVAFGCVVGMEDLANGINAAFNTISSKLNSALV
jgi:Flp pilus assembly pilin Flp